MTIKELKNNILLALYERYKNGDTSPVNFDELCSLNSIIFDSEKQLFDAVESLYNNNYLNATFYINNKGVIHNVTPDGVQFVEENLLSQDDLITDGLNDTDKLIKSGAKIDIDSNTVSDISDTNKNKHEHEEKKSSTIVAYNAKENYLDYKDSSVEPCFGVTALATCFIKQLDKIAEHTNDKFCMLGIFGPWGRGKTYFFHLIKDILRQRSDKRFCTLIKNIFRTQTDEHFSKRVKDSFRKWNDERKKKKYIIIEFNAWKYQDTPAIWAYLYETIYQEGLNWIKRSLFCIKCQILRHWQRLLSIIILYILVWILYNKVSELNDLSENVKSIMLDLKVPLTWITALSGILYSIIKNPISVHVTIEKYFKRKSYKGMLGIQNDLEQDLESLVENIAKKPEKKQIILYVDDIDRCESSKILNVVNSLRLILENTIIQKRMIVICSIDAEKLVEAYCCNKYSGDSTKAQRKEAREHLDKLFIFGVGLPSLDQSQQIEYLKKLYSTNEEKDVTQPPFSINRQKRSFIPTPVGKELVELTDNKLGEYLSEYLEKNKLVGLTPRQIRIIYYRLLFANNIIASGDALIKEETLEQIINLSINVEHPDSDIDTAGSDVVDMVVPY